MDFLLMLFLGLLALPWYWIAFASVAFLADVILVESDEFGFGTAVFLGTVSLVAWWGADVNILAWTWSNLGDLFHFLGFYFLIGAMWSVIKWYLYLLQVRSGAREKHKNSPGVDKESRVPKRPSESYVRNNKGRLMGWVAHWPFSMVGTLIGDFLKRLVNHIYRMLRGIYERIADHVFSDFSN